MSVLITISGTPIQFPSSGQDPNWAPAVIQFAQLVASALSGVVGTFDVPPQEQDLSGAAFNPTTSPVDITALNFPTTEVRAVFVKYTIYRTALSPSTAVHEAGEITAVYDAAGVSGSLWEVTRQSDGNALATFSVSDTGQFSISLAQIGTTNATGKIVFSAVALLQNP